ncbi:MAG: hypothetical protein AAF721_17910 [Myxococcota bacterium]
MLLGGVLASACSFGGRGRKGTVPVQPDLPPLPDYVEMCVSKAVSLPGKMNGQAWDGIGKIGRKERKLIPDLAKAAAGGGYAAATAAAMHLGPTIFNKVKGPPDLRVRVQLGREFIIRTSMVKDTPIAAFPSSEANCAVIKAKEYGERVQFIVEDLDVGRPEVVGTISLVGIPAESIRKGTWEIFGFDQVVEIGITLQPMEKPKPRAALPPDDETPPPDEATPPAEAPPPAQPAPAQSPPPAEPGIKEPFSA